MYLSLANILKYAWAGWPWAPSGMHVGYHTIPPEFPYLNKKTYFDIEK